MKPSVETQDQQQDRRWHQLLDCIEAGIVVPVVGRELLWTTIDSQKQYVPALLARELAGHLGLTVPEDAGADPVNAVVHAFLKEDRKTRHWPYVKIAALTAELNKMPVPESLLK